MSVPVSVVIVALQGGETGVLARLLADKEEWGKAITLLDGSNTGEFTSLYEEARGDILLGQNNPVKARAAYERSTAVSILSSGQSRSRLQMKLDDLGDPETALKAKETPAPEEEQPRMQESP